MSNILRAPQKLGIKTHQLHILYYEIVGSVTPTNNMRYLAVVQLLSRLWEIVIPIGGNEKFIKTNWAELCWVPEWP